MKNIYTSLIILTVLLHSIDTSGQLQENYMLRMHEDNDFFNIIGNRTDRSYTNGTRIDFFQRCKSGGPRFLFRSLPSAGDSSVNICGWSVAQLMVTPEDISKEEFQPNDYRYAGALFLSHSYHSYNPSKKYSYQYETLVGLRGPEAMAEQTQVAIHRIINSQEPRGWDNQLDTQLLLNFTFTLEKNLVSCGNIFELNAGVQSRIGTLMNGVLVFPLIRIGKMSPYFEGPLGNRYHMKGKTTRGQWQYYLIARATASFVAYNALLDGERANTNDAESDMPIANYIGDVQMGLVLSYKNVGASYILTRSSSYDEGLYEHRYGTIQLFVKW